MPAAPDRGCKFFQIIGRFDDDIEETNGSMAATLAGTVFRLERALDEKANNTGNPSREEWYGH